MVSLDTKIAAFDVEVFLRNQGYTPYVTGDELNMDCPFCGGKQKFYINRGTKRNLCHKCGWRGGLLSFMEECLKVDSREAIQLLNENRKHFDLVAMNREKVQIEKSIELPEFYRPLRFPKGKTNGPYWEYVLGRGLLPSVVLDYKLGYCRKGRFKERVVVPVYWFGKLATWVARAIYPAPEEEDEERPFRKIQTPFGNDQSDYLFNLDKLWGRNEIILVEGPFDMLRHPGNTVASFGKKISAEQIRLLRHAGVQKVVIAYDDDARDSEGRNKQGIRRLPALWKTAQDLDESGFEVFLTQMPSDDDPGSLSDARFGQIIKEAQPYTTGALLRVKAGLQR